MKGKTKDKKRIYLPTAILIYALKICWNQFIPKFTSVPLINFLKNNCNLKNIGHWK